jgi:hypothetical protein
MYKALGMPSIEQERLYIKRAGKAADYSIVALMTMQ